MALDKELIGVVGACSALFVMFCIIAAFTGYFCLRRARRRRQEKLLEEAQKEEEKRNNSYHRHSLTHSRQSTARSNATSNNMSSYRPKILDHSMVANAYDGSAKSSLRDGKAISTIFVGDKRSSGRKKEINNLDYNQMNGFIVKGFLHSPNAEKTLNEFNSRNGNEKGEVFVTPLDRRHGFILEEPEVVRTEHHVIRQSVEMGPDGKLVVSNYQQETDSPSVNPPTKVEVEQNQVHTCSSVADEIRLVEESPRLLTASVNVYSGVEETTSGRMTFDPYSTIAEMSDSKPVYEDQIVQSVESHTTTTALEPNSPRAREEEDVYSTVMKVKTTDHFKVIKREHSTHTKVPEWPATSQTVDEVNSDIKINSVTIDDVSSANVVAEHLDTEVITNGTEIISNIETVTEFTTISGEDHRGIEPSQTLSVDTSGLDHSVISDTAASMMIVPPENLNDAIVPETGEANITGDMRRDQPKSLASTITAQESETLILRHVSIRDKQYINNTDPLVGEETSVAAKIRAFEQTTHHSTSPHRPPPTLPKPATQSIYFSSETPPASSHLPPLYEDDLASHLPASNPRQVSFDLDAASVPPPPPPPPPPSLPPPFLSSSNFNSLPTPPPTPPSSPSVGGPSTWPVVNGDGYKFVSSEIPSGFGISTAQIDFGDEHDTHNRIVDMAENERVQRNFYTQERKAARVTFG